MTRFLSHALEAREPHFRLGLRKLEEASGNPSTDIRFTAEVMHDTKRKILELGLDPRDTAPVELYRALGQRLRQDDKQLTRRLRTLAATHVSAEADVVAGMVHALKELPDSKRCFALKASSLKAMLRKQPPKKAMKQLGYRSLDSTLKHEQPVLMLAAAWLSEGPGWRKKLLDQYSKLKSNDFEHRSIILARPDSARWAKFGANLVAETKHNIISFKEFGAIVFLPLPADAPQDGAVTSSLSLALHELNEIRVASTFMQMQQMHSDFGRTVSLAVTQEPRLNSELLDQPVSWNLIQRYYSKLKHQFREEIFEPHLQAEAMVWHSVEEALARIESRFEFWTATPHLAMLDKDKPVSMNLADVAINFCNRLSYEQRAFHYAQKAMWHELMLRYLKPSSVEATIMAELQPKLAEEPVLA